jgi:two-component system, OmpR family, sensor histidine kinase MtrB
VLYDSRASFDTGLARSTELMSAELDRFEALLADLLEISRFDAGAAALEPEPIDLRGLVTRALESTDGLAKRRGVTVVPVLPAEPCIAEVDTRRVERILRNLVSNAVEYSALDLPSDDGRAPGDRRVGRRAGDLPRSRVVVDLAGDSTAVAITVRDRGIGLQPGEAVLVFNRFWRADPARAKTRGGTGLGLSISLEDAQLHGGWLQAWGEPGRGSNFRLTLPRQAGAPLTHSPLSLVPADVALAQARLVGADYQRVRPERGWRAHGEGLPPEETPEEAPPEETAPERPPFVEAPPGESGSQEGAR